MQFITALLPFLFGISAATATTPAGRRQLRGGRRDLAEEHCRIETSLSCQVFENGSLEGQDCETFLPRPLTLDQCRQTPLTTTLLYNGGDCSQTDNGSFLGVACQDGASLPPPVQEGEQSYIAVTAASDPDRIYFEGYVAVGDTYELDGGGSVMDDGFLIQIYDSDDKRFLLQQVLYSKSLCSSTVEFLSRFGASQIVEYTNDSQGKISAFATNEYEVKLDVTFSLKQDDITLEKSPEKETKREVTMESATLLTNFDGFIDLTDVVKDQVIAPNKPVIVVTTVANIDFLSQRQRYTALVQATGRQSDDDEDVCTGTDFLHFVAGV